MKTASLNLRFFGWTALAFLAGRFETPAFGQGGSQISLTANATYSINQPVYCSASDGTNYLVGFQIHRQPGDNRVVAQLVSPTGAALGPLIDPGAQGDVPKAIGFDGTNYLLAWRQATTGPGATEVVMGQFISRAGALVGSPFQISQAVTVQQFDAVGFDGTNYLITWSDERRSGIGQGGNTQGDRDIYARRVSKAGTALGSDFKISVNSGYDSALAFDGTNFLVIWRDDSLDTDIRGRLVTSSGGFAGTELTIDANAFPSDNPSAVIFDGTKYVVAINDQVGGLANTDSWDIFARFVTTAGTVLPARISITTAAGSQLFPRMAFDGVNYLFTWLDGVNINNVASSTGTCKARFFDSSGAPVGAEFTPFTAQGNKVPLLGPLLFNGTKYFAVTALEEILASDTGRFGGFNNGEVVVTFISPRSSASPAPVIVAQAQSQTVSAGSNVAFIVTATGTAPLSYQWFKGGSSLANAGNVSGATTATLALTGVTTGDAGSYSVVITSAGSSITSNAATLSVTPVATLDPGRLTNLSILTDISVDVPNFTVGTVIGGAGTSGTEPLLVRAAGPSLAQLGLGGVLPDPKLDFYSGSSIVASNDDWGGTAALAAAITRTGAFPFASASSKDAAVFNAATAAGSYSVVVSGKTGAVGTVIAEIYDATPAGAFSATTPRLVNVSVLKQLSPGSTLTLGFTIGGSTSQTVLIRVIGPALGLPPFNIAGVMADPQLTVFNSANAVVATNNDWGGTAALTTAVSRTGAFAVASATSKDAMLVLTLPPGGYTAQASGVGGGGGFAIIEVYEVP